MVGGRTREVRALRLLALTLILVPTAARAQGRYTVGVAGAYARPLGEFGKNVRQGFGLDGFGTLGVDSRGIFSLRADLGYVQYSSKTEPFFLSDTSSSSRRRRAGSSRWASARSSWRR